jgi:hypothetical protein
MNLTKTKLVQIIKEEINEGVADTLLQKRYGVQPEFTDFERQYNLQQLKKKQMGDRDVVVNTDGNCNLIKNPSSLNNIGNSVRGVILPNGDLYLESFSEKIHYDLLRILANLHLLFENPKKNWSRKLPQESGFLTVQRYKNSPYISIGESNMLIYEKGNYDKLISYYKIFLDKAKTKNPGINFSDKLVGTKYFNTADESVKMNESYI